MKADILRDRFLGFFKSKGHRIISSDSLVPKDDPSVLFTPAGMNQFKKEFLSQRPGYRRVATCQRCLRTDDLDKVGKTSGHHTFFEMLGNFSFGDYFKKEAIAFAWEFLTQVLKIDRQRLWASVYVGDDESYSIWKEKVNMPAAKIIKLGDKENFWPSEAKLKGPNGPCGPCSEIFFDQGREVGCGRPNCNPSCDCDRFVEVWNLVFTQFNRKQTGVLEPLPKKNIDTGMGLERLAAVIQVVNNNFETDLFRPLVKEITRGLKKYEFEDKRLIYAVADHIRAIAFAIYDGVLPSNEARGYVVRKLIRKSSLHLRALGLKKAFLYKLVPVLSETMKAPYPQMQERRENLSQIILAEEKGFISTLDSSDRLLKEMYDDKISVSDSEKAGEIAFRAYDTYGIPVELTRSWLDKQDIKISHEIFNNAFDSELEEQKSRSKLQSAMSGNVFGVKGLGLDLKKTKFSGYRNFECRAKILKIIKGDEEINKISKADQAKVILDETVFYPESGGQIGDTGELIKGKNIFQVLDTKKLGNLIVHIGRVKQGNFKKSDSLLARIDIERRLDIARNHTATHLLQAALRQVLGPHVQQQGSLVAEDRLRFDFTHFKDINKQQLDRIEEMVNRYILNNHSLEAKSMPLSKAKRSGALAFFGEKYEEKVRVISISDFSKELCGGTHLDFAGQIGTFKIIQESSVASGVRRIEAQTGNYAYKTIKHREDTIDSVSSALLVPKDRIIPELKKKLLRMKELEKQLKAHKLNTVEVEKYIRDAETINDIKVITCNIKDVDLDILRKTVDLIKQRSPTKSVILSGTCNASRAWLVIGITQDLCDRGIDAAKLIKQIAGEVGGSGGGRKDFAQAGGNKPENLKNALEKLKEIL